MGEYEQKSSLDLDQPAKVHQPAHLLAETAQIPHIPIPPIPKDKTSSKSKTKAMNWKEREAAAERGESPTEPPPAYQPAPIPPHARTRSIPAMISHIRSSSLHNLKHAASHHLRSSSMRATHMRACSNTSSQVGQEPAQRSDNRVWYRKRRNTLPPAFAILLLLAIILIVNFAYVVPHKKAFSSPDLSKLSGDWTISAPTFTDAKDSCAANSAVFRSCKASAEPLKFAVSSASDGSYTGAFDAGSFSTGNATTLPLSQTPRGLQTSLWTDEAPQTGMLSSTGCTYERQVQLVLTYQNKLPVYQLQTVYTASNCKLPSGKDVDTCTCNYSGNRS